MERPGDTLRTVGGLMLAVGLGLFVVALVMDTSVPTDRGAHLSELGVRIPERIHNLDLAQRQLLLAIAGGTLFVSGWIAIGAASIAAALPADSAASPGAFISPERATSAPPPPQPGTLADQLRNGPSSGAGVGLVVGVLILVTVFAVVLSRFG